jgi:hypothetical protein
LWSEDAFIAMEMGMASLDSKNIHWLDLADDETIDEIIGY